jgi:hypothetical protein
MSLHLSRLADRELIHHAWMSTNALTSTELESHLLERYERALDAADAAEPLLDALAREDIDNPDQVESVAAKARALDERVNGIALLDVLLEHDIDNPATLRRILERDAQVRDILTQLTRPLADLQNLTTPA